MRLQEERRRHLVEFPPVRNTVPTFKALDLSNAYPHITLSEAPSPPSTNNYEFDKECGKNTWTHCDEPYCGTHVCEKLKDWHSQREQRPPECEENHFFNCRNGPEHRP
ncbi:hypothetical protein ACQKWADRAFT_317714 [Trichoderma austrokoningii]